MKTKVAICLDAEVCRKIEQLRGMRKRSNYVQHLIEIGLKAPEEAKADAVPTGR